MLTLPSSVQVFVASKPVDLRKSFDGLSGVVEGVLGKDPASGQAKMAEAHGAQLEKLQRLVERLEKELCGAIDRKAKAIARAQLTRSGHVYVLSNIDKSQGSCRIS